MLIAIKIKIFQKYIDKLFEENQCELKTILVDM